MGVTVTNLTAGPADIYTAAFGASETGLFVAAWSAPASATWTDMGGTDDGIKLVIDQNYMELQVDQIVDIPGRRLTKRELTLETKMAEPTLANLKLALNAGTVTASAGAFTQFDPVLGDTSATQPTYTAVMFDGWAPATNVVRRRVLGRKMLSVDGAKDSEYKKDGQTFFGVKFSGHYVSASTGPFKVHDFTS